MQEEDQTIGRKAKTHKGRKILESREAKVEEGPRKTLFLKSTKTSEKISKLSHEMYLLKKAHSLSLNKRYDIRPFEKNSELEFLSQKYDTPLFVLTSNSKKRPENMVLGRVYENQILDMVEFGVQDFKSQEDFKRSVDIPTNARPCVTFQGDLFEFDSNYIRLKNLLLDFFVENIEISNFNILNFSHLVSFSLEKEGEIRMNVYSIHINSITDSKNEKFNLEEIGPSCKFVMRRHQFANDELYKLACKQPKIDKSKNKNVKTTRLGEKKGRLYVERQNLDAIALKKRKKLKTNSGKEKKNFAQKEKELQEELE